MYTMENIQIKKFVCEIFLKWHIIAFGWKFPRIIALTKVKRFINEQNNKNIDGMFLHTCSSIHDEKLRAIRRSTQIDTVLNLTGNQSTKTNVPWEKTSLHKWYLCQKMWLPMKQKTTGLRSLATIACLIFISHNLSILSSVFGFTINMIWFG